MIVVGVDQSLTRTGLARFEHGTLVELGAFATRKMGHERLEAIEDRFAQIIVGADLVVLEGISYGSFDKGKAIAGLWWILAHRAWEERIPQGSLPPATRAKFATDNGKATKREVIDAVNGEWFPGVVVTDDKGGDKADAVVLAAAGARMLGEPIDLLPEERWPLILKGNWPDI